MHSYVVIVVSETSNGGEEECILDISGKTRRKETTRKTKTYVGGQLSER
jgi:hypothetical protein